MNTKKVPEITDLGKVWYGVHRVLPERPEVLVVVASHHAMNPFEPLLKELMFGRYSIRLEVIAGLTKKDVAGKRISFARDIFLVPVEASGYLRGYSLATISPDKVQPDNFRKMYQSICDRTRSLGGFTDTPISTIIALNVAVLIQQQQSLVKHRNANEVQQQAAEYYRQIISALLYQIESTLALPVQQKPVQAPCKETECLMQIPATAT